MYICIHTQILIGACMQLFFCVLSWNPGPKIPHNGRQFNCFIYVPSKSGSYGTLNYGILSLILDQKNSLSQDTSSTHRLKPTTVAESWILVSNPSLALVLAPVPITILQAHGNHIYPRGTYWLLHPCLVQQDVIVYMHMNKVPRTNRHAQKKAQPIIGKLGEKNGLFHITRL